MGKLQKKKKKKRKSLHFAIHGNGRRDNCESCKGEEKEDERRRFKKRRKRKSESFLQNAIKFKKKKFNKFKIYNLSLLKLR